MTITLNGTTGITTPAIDNQGNLTVSGALNTTGLSASTAGLLTVPSGASIYTVGSGTFGLNVAGELTIASGRDNGGDTIVKTSNTERMRIDGAGRVTMPYQPMFRSGGNASNTTVTVNTQEFVPFSNTPIINVGGHFNNATSRFTAPVSGIYYVGFSIMLSANFLDYTYFWTSFTVNGNGLTNLEFMLPRAGGGAYTTHQGNTYLSLTAGDYVQVRYYQSQGTAIQIRDSFRSFQGHLVG
jgi:hypothetical protein